MTFRFQKVGFCFPRIHSNDCTCSTDDQLNVILMNHSCTARASIYSPFFIVHWMCDTEMRYGDKNPVITDPFVLLGLPIAVGFAKGCSWLSSADILSPGAPVKLGFTERGTNSCEGTTQPGTVMKTADPEDNHDPALIEHGHQCKSYCTLLLVD